jgi:iron complex transport system substrate-binding protein
LSELITLAGGINIFDDVSQDYTVISKESLLKRQPDIIIEPYAVFRDNKKDTAQAIKDWSKLGALNAVKNNRIYFIEPDLVLKPGPRIGQATLKLAMLLHPELFSE